jgi:hypothetical protein
MHCILLSLDAHRPSAPPSPPPLGAVFTLAAELLPVPHRSFWLSTVAWWWMVGALFSSGAAWLIIGVLDLPWQLFAVVATAPAAIASALVMLLLPESPHFLAGKGSRDAARDALIYIARVSMVESRLVRGWDLDDIGAADGSGARKALRAPADADADAARLEGSSGAAERGADSGGLAVGGASAASAFAASGASAGERDGLLEGAAGSSGASGGGGGGGALHALGALAGVARGGTAGAPLLRAPRAPALLSRVGDALRPIGALFTGPHARTATLLAVVWFMLSFGWYGLLLWLPSLFKASDVELDVYQDAFLVNCANLPGNLISAFLMDRVGTKSVLVVSMLLACASAAAFPFARTEAMVLLASCSLNAVSTCSWNALDCLSTEAFPSRQRTTSLGVLSAAGRIGSIAGQFVFGALADVSTAALLASAAGALGIGAAAALSLPVGGAVGGFCARPGGEKLDEGEE